MSTSTPADPRNHGGGCSRIGAEACVSYCGQMLTDAFLTVLEQPI